ncbi:MAG TPA: CaiB/BaiF CoA-transferase family protein [Steroidobacteraceae bacterium]|jgi:alpha-methylacyl-CoA racemase|nr:CaiB/BaiF CoA-transferase family protein [Steroidobacteraceae bacterium]
MNRDGSLAGLKIIEIAGIGPAPFCAMMLADHGAEVIRIVPPGADRASLIDPSKDILARSRKAMIVDLKQRLGVEAVRDLCKTADGLIEGFRPGVMERLGLGPDLLLSDNPKLVYGRMTGWGQSGPRAHTAGHDINYIALSGVLDCVGRAGDKPTPPVNLIGDFGGGGMLLAFGMLAAILHSQKSGEGQVIDCAMVDGSALLASMIWSFVAQGAWSDKRGSNTLDTGAHFYDAYACADGGHISIGPIEPKFYSEFLRRLGIAETGDFARQHDRTLWPSLKERLAAVFAAKTRAEWCAIFEGSDACIAPVLSLAEAPQDPHNAARGTFIEVGGVTQPRPAPRFSATAAPEPVMPQTADGTDSAALLRGIGYSEQKIRALHEAGAVH